MGRLDDVEITEADMADITGGGDDEMPLTTAGYWTEIPPYPDPAVG